METETAATPVLHSIPTVMGMTDLGRSTIYQLMDSGELESVKIGARRLIPHDAVLQFIAELRGGNR